MFFDILLQVFQPNALTCFLAQLLVMELFSVSNVAVCFRSFCYCILMFVLEGLLMVLNQTISLIFIVSIIVHLCFIGR